jgi:hypothetical protein
MIAKGSPFAVLLANHRSAVREFVATARMLDQDTWLSPRGSGKWSPALLTEHVALGIEAFTAEVGGRAGMALKLTPWRRFVNRRVYLPRLLRAGRFPEGVRAPRETRPGSSPRPQAEALQALERAVTDLEISVGAHPRVESCRVTHPYFGRLPLATSLRLLEVHARHHLSQLPRRVREPPNA